jgi:hypothetical protein
VFEGIEGEGGVRGGEGGGREEEREGEEGEGEVPGVRGTE